MLLMLPSVQAFPTYFYYIYIRIPDFFNGLWFNIVTGLLLFCSGIHYVFMLSWFSVVCSEGEVGQCGYTTTMAIFIDYHRIVPNLFRPFLQIRAKGFFTQILLICVWGLCMNIIHGQWILLLVCLGMMVFWIGIYETCFWPDYLGIPDHPQEEQEFIRPPSYSNV